MECPHLTSISKINNPFISDGCTVGSFECSVCQAKHNTWMCIHCGIINCGRYANGHAVKHFEHTQHHIISIDCNNLSIFCYICDNFVINAKPSKHFQKLCNILQRNQKSGFISKHREVKVKDNKHSLKSIKKIPKGLKLSGLRNLGNTCFMNAVLQSLSNIQQFSYPFTNMPSLENGQRSTLLKPLNSDNILITEELRKTIILLGEKKKSVISPQSLFSVIWKIVPRFKGYKQQDAQEFLRYMLDRLHTELTILFPHDSNQLSKNLSNTSIVTSLFRGVLQNEVKCLVCGTESKKHDPFFDLSLDIPQKFFDEISNENCLLTECLNKFTELEELAETELYNCPTCKQKQKSTKKFWIQRLPKVLCLHLKRFKWSECFRSKVDVHIEFPIKDLDMSSFMLANKHETRNNSGSPFYDLSAVIVHHGNGAGTGHYTSFATHQGFWHHFNDSTVTICNEETVTNSKAYILFYVQRERDKINIK